MKAPTIIFVDDEPITRRISTRLLERLYKTTEADSVKQALEILETEGENVGVVITDMKMPVEDGLALIDNLARNFPKISIIASTGDLSKYDFPGLIEEEKIFAAVEKPWESKKVLDTVKSAMDAYESAE